MVVEVNSRSKIKLSDPGPCCAQTKDDIAAQDYVIGEPCHSILFKNKFMASKLGFVMKQHSSLK